jgi:hypothetical protein
MSKAVRRRKSRKPLPEIKIEGDTLVPKATAAKELGICVRTLSRMKPKSILIGGWAYVAIGALRRQIVEKLETSTERRRRRR